LSIPVEINGYKVSFSYAQHISLQKDIKLIPSLLAGLGKNIINADRLAGPVVIIREKSYFDISAGLLLKADDFYAGVVVAHLNRPDVGNFNYRELPVVFTWHLSYNVKLSENNLLHLAAALFRENNASDLKVSAVVVLEKHVILGTGLAYSRGWLNIGYRHNYFNVNLSISPRVLQMSNSPYSISAAFTMRDIERRKDLTGFESW
jgi:hypothetical protein